MKKVLHLTEYLYQGGVERLLDQIARCTPRDAAELVFFGYQCPRLDGIGRELQSRGYPVYVYDKPGGFDFKLLGKLIAVVRRHGIRTLHTHDFGPMEYAVALKLRFPRLQLVHTHHSLHYFLKFPKYVWFFQVAGQFYDRLLCVSDHVREVLSRECPRVRRKLETVHNGVDLEWYDTGELGPLRMPLRLVTVCRISPEKNLAYLLENCRDLDRRKIPFTLEHAGSGDRAEEEKLRQLVQTLGLGQRVTLHGFQSDVRPILARGDIFVSTSLTEGHPVALLEAMAAGKLCVCSDIAPHRMISSEGLSLFPLTPGALAERLAEISREPDRFLANRQATRATVRDRFPLQKMIDSYLGVYL